MFGSSSCVPRNELYPFSVRGVAALEGIRLDLLRLHAGASDLAPLTTLIDAARLVGEDVRRLADAQREVDDATARRPLGAEAIPTPE